MTRIQCLTMQKNEATLLEPWILWHAALFGLENLTVLDNGSTGAHVLHILETYEAKGLRVLRDYATQDDFIRKGEIMVNLIREQDARDPYDFSIPMDCDEFLAFFVDRLSLDRQDILAAFESLKHENATLITDRMLLNVPEAPGYFRPQSVRRAMFRARTALSLDHGYHAPLTTRPERWVRTPFVYIHLHNRPDYEQIRRYARQKLAHIPGAIPGDAASEAQREAAAASQEGYHLRYYFLASREEFLASYRDAPDIYAPVITHRLESLGLDVKPLLGVCAAPAPAVSVSTGFLAHRTTGGGQAHDYVLFDPMLYARENTDVVQDAYYGIWPLLHFLDAGWNEGRRPNAFDLPPLTILAPSEMASLETV